mgnify:CR=1 FL=1
MSDKQMIIYQVVGRTARIDWTDRSEDVSLGFYYNEKAAKQEVSRIKSTEHWYMDYDSVKVVPVKVNM